MESKVVIKEPKPFKATRLMYNVEGTDVVQYPNANVAIDYAINAGYTVFGDIRNIGQEVTASRPDMPGDTWILQQLRQNQRWVWNRK